LTSKEGGGGGKYPGRLLGVGYLGDEVESTLRKHGIKEKWKRGSVRKPQNERVDTFL